MEHWKLNLCLFGEGGGGEGGGGAAGAAGAGDGGAAPEAAGAGEQGENRAQAFEQLIKGEYAEEFNARTQAIIDKRFKETKNLEKQMEKLKPVLDALSAKYGETDHDKLIAAVNADNSYYQEAADNEGMTVEQFRERENLRQKARSYDAMQAERQRVERERQVYAEWNQQSKTLKESYPQFDFAAECKNPETGPTFLKLLGQGVSVETAYKTLHMDELLSGAIRTAVATTQQRTVQTIAAQGRRPSENGVGGSVATQLKTTDPGKMTKAERDALVRRAARGERITFGN